MLRLFIVGYLLSAVGWMFLHRQYLPALPEGSEGGFHKSPGWTTMIATKLIPAGSVVRADQLGAQATDLWWDVPQDSLDMTQLIPILAEGKGYPVGQVAVVTIYPGNAIVRRALRNP